jgi:hypothetical protein
MKDDRNSPTRERNGSKRSNKKEQSKSAMEVDNNAINRCRTDWIPRAGPNPMHIKLTGSRALADCGVERRGSEKPGRVSYGSLPGSNRTSRKLHILCRTKAHSLLLFSESVRTR